MRSGQLKRLCTPSSVVLTVAAMIVVFYPASAFAQTMASSVSQHGITWYFDKAYPVGQFVTGDWYVVGAVKVIDIDPGSVEVDGRIKNGSMVNPSVSNATGYDNYGGRGSDYYDHELNAGWNVSEASPLILDPGSSLMSTISRENPSHPNTPLKVGAVLTVLESEPPDDAFRPPYVGDDKSIRYRANDVQVGRLPTLPVGGIDVPDPAEWAASRITHWDHGVQWRKQHVIPGENTPDHGYGRGVAHRFDQALGILISDYSPSEKERLLNWFVQAGLDLYGVVDWSLNNNVTPFSPDGFHNHGRKMPIVVTGYLLSDTDMQNIKDRAGGCFFQEDAMYDYVNQDDIDATNSEEWDPSYGDRGSQPYSQEMLGMPEWLSDRCRGHVGPEKGNAYWGAHGYRYGGQTDLHHMVALGVLSMGLKDQWGNDAFFDYMHRFVSVMDGDTDPFGVNSYEEVDGVPGPGGAEGWEKRWHSRWRHDMFLKHWDSYYPDGAESKASPEPPQFVGED